MSRYKILSIEKITPPAGAANKRWYKYIIANNYNTITSISSGSEKEIRKFALESAKRLNDKYLTRCKAKSYSKPVYEATFSTYL